VCLIRDRLVRLLTQLNCTSVVCPYPNGSSVHPHHRAVFHAVCDAQTAVRNLVVYWVSDIPYSHLPVDRPLVCRGRLYIPEIYAATPGEMCAKLEAMRIFDSQYPSRYFDRIQRSIPGDVRGRRGETLWVPLTAPRVAHRVSWGSHPKDLHHVHTQT